MPPVNPRLKICTSGCTSSSDARRVVAAFDAVEETRDSVFVTVATYSGFFFRPSTLRQTMPASAIAGRCSCAREILGGDEVAAIELRSVGGVGEHVVLAARLRARAAIRAALRDHARHEALAGVRDAERAVHERLEPESRNGGADRADVVERVLAREHDAIDAKLLHHRARRDSSCTVICVDP